MGTIVVVGGTSDFNNRNNNHSPTNWNYPPPYVYHEIRSADENNNEESDAEPFQDSWQFSAADASDDVPSDDAASVVSSSLLYDGGCYVSSQAIMCQGGGGGDVAATSSTSNSAAADAILQHILDDDIYSEFLEAEEEDKEDDDEDEQDDDGDDDGHSSMLSNASLKRSKTLRKARCYAGGASKQSNGSQQNESHKIHRSALMSGQNGFRKQSPANLAFLSQPSKNISSSMLSSALQVRGGAAAAGPELTKRLVNAAIVTLIFELCCGHILEFFKIVMQTSPPGTTYGSVYKDITSEKGLSGLWDGFIPWGVLQSVLKGGVFGVAYEAAEKLLVPLAEEGKIPMKLAMTMAGGIAGGFQGFVLSPTLLMKTRVMTNEVFRESMSLWQTTWKSMVIGGDIIKTEGLGSLMKGANTFATKRVFDWATRYFFADLFEALFVHLKGGSLSVSEKAAASLLGGVASTVLTLPLDVLVAKTQDAKKAGVKVSAWKLFSEELQKEGWVGLKNNYMRGFEARLLHVCLTTVVMKTMSPIVYNIIFGGK
jgi:Mitochondrial carrier protein